MYNKKYKRPFWTIEEGPVTGLVSPMSLLFTLFSGWIPIWGVEARHVYLLAPASKIHRGGAQGGAPPAIQEDAGGLT